MQKCVAPAEINRVRQFEALGLTVQKVTVWMAAPPYVPMTTT